MLIIFLSQGGIAIFNTNDYYGEVLETGVSRTVNGTTYNDVVKFGLTTFTTTMILQYLEILSVLLIF